jgi:hypothetical protein
LAAKKTDVWVKYRGEAKFNAYEGGRYVFQIDVVPPKLSQRNIDVNCAVDFLVSGESVITQPQSGFYNFRDGQTSTISGGKDLEPANYDVTFIVGCQNTSHPIWAGLLGLGNLDALDYNRESFLKTEIDISVRGPTDDVARRFGARELFTLVKVEAASPAQKPKADARQPTPPGPKSAEKALPWTPKN